MREAAASLLDKIKAFFSRIPKKSLISCLSAAAILTVNLTAGAVLYAMPEENSAEIKIGIIQVNHDALDKDKVSSVKIWDDAEALAEKAIEEGATLLLYSETVLTVNLPTHSLGLEVSDFSKEHGIPQLIGAFCRKAENGEAKTYNSLYYIDKNGEYGDRRYDKRHLVPFGEYLPMPAFFETFMPWVCELMLNSLTPGVGNSVIDTEAHGKVGALICFDSIYPSLTRESVKDGAEWLSLSTNDYWFTDTQAIDQHLAHAALRAVESGRYVARSAATGRSALIDTKGNYVAILDEGVPGYLTAVLKPQTHTTLYTRIGDLFPLLCLFLPAALLLFDGCANLKNKKEK